MLLRYIELKSGFNDDGPAWIGHVTLSKSGRTIYFDGKALKRCRGKLGHYVDIETGEDYWISGIKKRGSNRHWVGSGTITVEAAAVADYLHAVGVTQLDARFVVSESIQPTDPQRFHAGQNRSRLEPSMRARACGSGLLGDKLDPMRGSEFDEERFFAAIASSGARALLIGRRALVALGFPMMTGDYDFWIHTDDVELFNRALAPLGFAPSREPADARRSGRFALENDEHVDVLLAQSVPTVDGQRVAFDDVWSKHVTVAIYADVEVSLPSLDDLIATKRFGARPKDAEDIRLLEGLRAKRPDAR